MVLRMDSWMDGNKCDNVLPCINLFCLSNIRDLSNNNLTGGVPEFLGDMKSLMVMYVIL